jgi:hypothetical protein
MDAKLYAIQKALQAAGHPPGPIDGVWGPETRDAIAAYMGLKAKPPTVASNEADAPWLDLAIGEIGTTEVPGHGNSAAILQYFEDAQSSWAKEDSIPWCAGFVGAMLARAGYKPSGSLMARSYLDWGRALDKPRRGCIVVLKRGAPPSGHVAFADDWTAHGIRVIGGNQSNSVTKQTFSRAGVLGLRWPTATL